MDSIAYLLSLEGSGINFGLERIRALCAALDHPERAYARVLVAGTNGKGSVTVMTETALRAAGHRVARYTSPHLSRLEERFVVDGQPVSAHVLGSAADTVRAAVDVLLSRGVLAEPPTFFEATTAVAFEVFRRAQVDLAVLEVGLGGRLDATNVSPAFAVAITNIDLDHQQYLGHSVREIAREKAGVIHSGARVVLGDTNPDVVEIVAETCAERGAHLVRAAEAASATSRLRPDGHMQVELRTPRGRYPPMILGLRGRHQLDNAITAAVLLESIGAAGCAVPPQAVEAGLTRARWPGRLELFALDDHRILLDAAHNPAGARSLAAYLREIHPVGLPVVFAVMRDKDVVGMLEALAPSATAIVATQVRNPRTLPASATGSHARATLTQGRVEVVPDPAQALDAALAWSPTVAVAGSIFLVGELRPIIEARGGVLLP